MELVLDIDHPVDGIRLDLDRARADLVDARRDQQRKDTPAARARVAHCIARVDDLLDLWNLTAPA